MQIMIPSKLLHTPIPAPSTLQVDNVHTQLDKAKALNMLLAMRSKLALSIPVTTISKITTVQDNYE